MKKEVPWDKIEKTEECWNWIGSIHDSGYGVLWGKGRRTRAHRLVYEALVGKIPPKMVIDHLCRNRRCVNPKHLEVVTQGENVLRGISLSAINKRKTHCFRGHEFDKENTVAVFNRTKNKMYRTCKKCKDIINV